jgi:hypothetical protein
MIPTHFRLLVLCALLLLIPYVAKAADGITLTWMGDDNVAHTSTRVSLWTLETSGRVTVIAAGTLPLHARMLGNCTFSQVRTVAAFTVNVPGGFCAFVVVDPTGRARALNLIGSPNRAFLTAISPQDRGSAAVIGSAGDTISYRVNHSLVMHSVLTPYHATVIGDCARVVSSDSPIDEAGLFSIRLTKTGECVLVFLTNGEGAATAVNLTVN